MHKALGRNLEYIRNFFFKVVKEEVLIGVEIKISCWY